MASIPHTLYTKAVLIPMTAHWPTAGGTASQYSTALVATAVKKGLPQVGSSSQSSSLHSGLPQTATDAFDHMLVFASSRVVILAHFECMHQSVTES